MTKEEFANLTAPQWQLFAHGADMGIRGFGQNMTESFEQTALALTAIITELDKVQEKQAITIHCQAPDPELLLLDWLNAIIYEMSTRKMLFKKFHINLNNLTIDAKIWGEPIDIVKHAPAVEPKAATFMELKVAKLRQDLWLAQAIIDV